MRTTSNMDYIYSHEGQPISIESIQKSARASVIEEFIFLRKSKRMTQSELAIRTGIPRPNITRFESGNYNPSLEMMVKIASALEADLRMELISREE